MERFVMRRISILAAAVGGLAIASTSFGAVTFSGARTAINGTTDRVVLYALSSVEADQLLGAEITAVSTAPMTFAPAAVNGDGVLEVGVKAANVLTATTTRAQSGVFQTVAPGYPLPSNISADDTTPPALASGNVTNFQIVGFDGRAEPTRGTNAGASVNGGLGAAIFAAIVPTGTVVTFTGKAGTEAGVSGNLNVVVPGGTGNLPPTFVGGPDFPVVVSYANGDDVNTPKPFSVQITVNDPDAGQTLVLTPGASPSGITNVQVTSVATGVGSGRTFTVTGNAAWVPFNPAVDYTLPFSVSDGASAGLEAAITGSISISVIPEPASLGALAGLGILALRRRK